MRRFTLFLQGNASKFSSTGYLNGNDSIVPIFSISLAKIFDEASKLGTLHTREPEKLPSACFVFCDMECTNMDQN